MYRRPSRALLAIAVLGVFAGLLLGLLVAAPAGTPSLSLSLPLALASNEGSSPVPWEPLSSPDESLRTVKAVVSLGSSKATVDKLASLRLDPTAPARTRGLAAFAEATLLAKQRATNEAIERFRTPEIAQATELGAYALFEIGDLSSSSDSDAAAAALTELVARHPGFVRIDEARVELARMLARRGDKDAAIEVLTPAIHSEDEEVRGDVLSELGTLLADRGRYAEAVPLLESLYYELPRHAAATRGGRLLTSLRSKLPDPGPAHFYRLGLRRAEALVEARRFSEAYSAFAALLQTHKSVADVDRLRLRMGYCQYQRRHLTASLTDFGKVTREELLPESLYYQAEVARRLLRQSRQQELVATLVGRFPTSRWTEKALYQLATHYDSNEEPERAHAYYLELAQKFPAGELALETKWQLNWDAYRSKNYDEAALGLEEAARENPGSDGLGRVLYWSGRSYQEAGRDDRAESLYRQVLLGYQNSYYGRRAIERLTELEGEAGSLAAIDAARSGIDLGDALVVRRVAALDRVAELDAVGLDRQAVREAEWAAESGGPDASAFLAVAAWIHKQNGRNLNAIQTIQNAFPFHGSATGDLLPKPIWQLFYPLDYWEHVQKYSAERELDPYLVAALIRQESTFNPRVRSRANARGLMQLIPATAQSLARQERVRYATSDLYNPEINIRYGTRYLKQVLAQFGGRVDYALAGYNAGPHRVTRWTAKDMTLDPEVFIEEIPFNETHDYVRLVLRNEMLYRRLYGGAGSTID